MTVPAPRDVRRPQWYRPRSIARSVAIRPRVYVATLAAVAAALLLPREISASIRAALAGDIGAAFYLVLGVQMMAACSRDSIRQRAARQDDSAIVILVLILVAISLGFWTIFGVLGEAKRATTGLSTALLTLLAGSTLLLSWLVTQVVFTFHYAHEYYRPEGNELAGGLVFPQDERPDYWDFFYFATSIGAASQTSDVAIRSKRLRRLVALHAIISFFFNTAVLALAINIGASLI